MTNPTTSFARRYGQAALTQLALGLFLKLGANFYIGHYTAGRSIAERVQDIGFVLIGLSWIYASFFLVVKTLEQVSSIRRRELVGLGVVIVLVCLAALIYLLPYAAAYLHPWMP